MSNFTQQLQKMKTQPGFIAALDQSGGSTPKALLSYGIKDDAWSNEDEMFSLVHQMRTRIITSPCFTGERILGAILFENTMDRDIQGQPTADYLWNVKRIVPFLKVDKGLAAEKDGVHLMKPMPGLAIAAGQGESQTHFRHQDAARSSTRPMQRASSSVVNQQFETARPINAAGLIPIVEPEVDIHCSEKAKAEELLKAAILDGTQQPAGRPIGHAEAHAAGTRRLLCGFRRTSACAAGGRTVGRLYAGGGQPSACGRNHGVVASFSRALVEGLTAQRSDAEYNAMLDASKFRAFLRRPIPERGVIGKSDANRIAWLYQTKGPKQLTEEKAGKDKHHACGDCDRSWRVCT